MLAAAVGVYENFHLGLKVLLDAVPTPIRTILEVINNSLIIIFGMAMLVNGSRLAQFTADHIMPALNISRSFAYWPFAAAGLFISIFALERLMLAVTPENSINPPINTEAVKR
jgi:TRAP-type C4-dicarboxylate transport system permease small subunit